MQHEQASLRHLKLEDVQIVALLDESIHQDRTVEVDDRCGADAASVVIDAVVEPVEARDDGEVVLPHGVGVGVVAAIPLAQAVVGPAHDRRPRHIAGAVPPVVRGARDGAVVSQSERVPHLVRHRVGGPQPGLVDVREVAGPREEFVVIRGGEGAAVGPAVVVGQVVDDSPDSPLCVAVAGVLQRLDVRPLGGDVNVEGHEVFRDRPPHQLDDGELVVGEGLGAALPIPRRVDIHRPAPWDGVSVEVEVDDLRRAGVAVEGEGVLQRKGCIGQDRRRREGDASL